MRTPRLHTMWQYKSHQRYVSANKVYADGRLWVQLTGTATPGSIWMPADTLYERGQCLRTVLGEHRFWDKDNNKERT